ncbi:MAG: AmmeMemoRadiSam system protein A [Bifidobacteriaceae bacterium]|jgi:AmmeMemoRadiSam system protein A|nr:AmmeMemoRadiSam system protein A [Bifidobacteriaceae bacterium]
MPSDFPPAAGPVLTALARQAIVCALEGRRPPAPDPAGLRVGRGPADGAELESVAALARLLAGPGAAFVTLTQGGDLRGCIGSLEAHRPLGLDVQSNAIDAAFGDPRFPPLAARELERTAIEVSVLSPPVPLEFADRDDLARRLRPGVDGLILQAAGRRGTFLPQVWEQLPTPELFLSHLVRKAGLPSRYWSDEVRIWRYTVTAFEEAAAAAAPPLAALASDTSAGASSADESAASSPRDAGRPPGS